MSKKYPIKRIAKPIRICNMSFSSISGIGGVQKKLELKEAFTEYKIMVGKD